jgi:DNA-directed RNA polymerase subunit K/omega
MMSVQELVEIALKDITREMIRLEIIENMLHSFIELTLCHY